MARISRVVIPDLPHHITQRGNPRQQTFFENEDYQHYLKLLAEWSCHFDVSIWAYCLMPNFATKKKTTNSMYFDDDC